MNQRKYRLYYEITGLTTEQRTNLLSADRVAAHFDYLPSELKHYFADKDTTVATEPVTRESGIGLYVTLTSSSSEVELDDWLVSCIRALNDRDEGMCYAISPMSSG